ncbi:hypothetical protein AGMMS49936_10920 [Endomicrobiia bacterium]|nr:hypothetical protein AGMMS49936_10920 [Endomicrobiia bacterium]
MEQVHKSRITKNILADRLVGAKNAATALVSTNDRHQWIGEDRPDGSRDPLETCRKEREYLDITEVAILLHTLGLPSKHVIGCLHLDDAKNWGYVKYIIR